MTLREENEPPCEFHDYTIVAIVATAAHLCGNRLGGEEERYGMPRLAAHYNQNADSLEQVSSGLSE